MNLQVLIAVLVLVLITILRNGDRIFFLFQKYIIPFLILVWKPALVIALILSPFITYNILIKKRNAIDNSYSSIDVILKKRYDLIPNIVSAVKGIVEHERSVFEEISNLRTKALSDNISFSERVFIEDKISSEIKKIILYSENYPILRSSENFLQLQQTLSDIEEQLSAARRTYNYRVTDYNNFLSMFPINLIVNVMGFKKRNLFEIDDIQRQNINLNQFDI